MSPRTPYPAADESTSPTFDEFLNQEFYTDEVEDGTRSSVFHIDNHSTTSALNSNNHRSATFPNLSQAEQNSAQPWREGLWCLNKSPRSQLTVEKARPVNEQSQNVSPARLIGHQSFATRLPRSLAQRAGTKTSPPPHTQQLHYSVPNGQPPVLHQIPLPYSPRYSKLIVDEQPERMGTWHQNSENLHLNFQTAMNQPRRGTGPDLEMSSFSSNPAKRPPFFKTFSAPAPTRAVTAHNNHQQQHEFARVTDGSVQNCRLPTDVHANMCTQLHDTCGGELQQNQDTSSYMSEDMTAASTWAAAPHSPSASTHYSQHSSKSWESRKHNLHNVLPLNNNNNNNWGTPSAAYHQMSSHTKQENFSSLIRPKHRRTNNSILKQDKPPIASGLGIQYPLNTEIGCAISCDLPEPLPYCTAQQATLQQESAAMNHHLDMLASYPQLPPPVPFTDESAFTSANQDVCHDDRTPSPPFSPTRMIPGSLRQRSSSRHESQHRRKSIHRQGPKADSSSTETPIRRSVSRTPRTPKTPKTPKTPHGRSFSQIDFVNFTPKDANKLLSDVAPSGSSKTRARREQEAREKSKKLSEAALLAVKKNGGDVDAFRRELLRRGEVEGL